MKEYNHHHLCARTRGWTNHPDNIRMMQERVHTAIHTLFWVALPNEQLGMIMDLNDAVFTHQFKSDVARILLLDDPDYVYKRWVLIPKK